MLMLVMSNNFLQLFFGWEAVGLVSYLLIGFWYERPTAIYANLKAFLANRVGDFGFVLGIGLVLAYFGTLDYASVFARAPELAATTVKIWGTAPWSLMIRTHYGDLFADDRAMLKRVDALAAKTWELTAFLVEKLRLASVPGRFDGTITYHDGCSGLREMGVKTQPRALLAKVPGIKLAEMPECEVCCGFGGTFAVKYGEISARLADNKCTAIAGTGADAVVLGDLGCMLNIEGRLRRRGDAKTRVLHVAEVLAGKTG